MQLDNKNCELTRLEGETKRLKSEVESTEQASNKIRGKMMDKELDIECLQVRNHFFNDKIVPNILLVLYIFMWNKGGGGGVYGFQAYLSSSL